MTRDDLAPLGESESFPCPTCGGSGVKSRFYLEGTTLTSLPMTCPECGGSGYGPPPPALDKAVEHCLCRLHKWAHRALPNTEEN